MNENVIFATPQVVKPVVSVVESPHKGFPKKFIKLLCLIFVILCLGFLAFSFVMHLNLNKKPKIEKVTLVYWGLYNDSNVVASIISDFERQNPNISVQYIKQDIKQYRERLLTRIQNGNGPDVFYFHNTWLPVIYNVLIPLPKDIVAKSDFEKWFYKVAQKDLTKNGAIYAVPAYIDTLSLFINTDLFKAADLQAPDNWIDFLTYSRQLTVKNENGDIQTAGAGVGTFDNITHAGDVISLFFAQNGSDLNNLSSVSPAASDALTFYTSFVLGEKVWDSSLDSSLTVFAKGNLAMYFGYSTDYFTIKETNPNLNFEIHPVPHLPNQNMTIASYWAQGISAKSKNPTESLAFIKFLVQKETEQKLFAEQSKTRAFGEPYARKDIAYLLKDNAIIYPFVSQAEDSVSSLFSSGTQDNGLNTKSNEHLRDAVNSILSGTIPQTAVDTLSQGMSQVVQQYFIK